MKLAHRAQVDIIYAKADLQELCNDGRVATKKLGAACAKKLRRRLDDLAAARMLAVCRVLPGRCHELKGDLAGCLAMDLDGGSRLIFRPDQEPVPTTADGGLDWSGVTRIRIVMVKDYHD